jgi:hypothetical protein
MATITRTEEMFSYNTVAAPRASFWDSLYRVTARLLMPDWVIQYAEDKAEEIQRQRLYYS